MNISQPADNIVLPGMKPRRTSLAVQHGETEVMPERRIRGLSWMPEPIRNHVIAMIGEFVGTCMFLFFAFAATQVANAAAAAETATINPLSPMWGAPNTSNLLYISLAFGFSLAVNVWVFFRISGGLFNPAVSIRIYLQHLKMYLAADNPQVTLGLALIGACEWIRAFLVIMAQILGAIAAAAVVSGLFPGPMAVRTTLGSGTSIARGCFIEMFLTAQLIFTIFSTSARHLCCGLS